MLLSALLLLSAHQDNHLQIKSVVAISGVSQGGRMAFFPDAVQASIVDGSWKSPKEGDKVVGPSGKEQTWKTLTADDKGEFTGPQLGGGYAYFNLPQLEHPSISLLCASGDTMAYVNGEPRVGDPYGYGYVKLPIKLKVGSNDFLFSCGRGRLNVAFETPKAPAMLNTGDMTLPDIMENDASELVGAVPVLNCTEDEMSKMTIGAQVGTAKERKFALPTLMPLSVRKLAFYMTPGKLAAGDQKLKLRLYRDGKKLDEQEVGIRVRKPDQHFKNTFVSKIDGSVQYYAVAPSLKPSKDNALILSVHGASVEALNQAQAYKPKDWCTVVAPTNRRPYGFDWEDWGRMDGMEVWEIAKALFPHDPQRVHLTGHSMGGHGTWQLGLTYPNEFASIGPSAGWVSFWSYAGGWEPKDPTPVEAMIRRSMNQSDTLAMLGNGLMEDIYVLHGDKDDNVPVEQARFMRDAFAKIGKTVQYHEEPGAGHWWGDQCVDWPPMFEMFKSATLGSIADKSKSWSFTTINPAVNSNYKGITIEQQGAPMVPSNLNVERGPDGLRIKTSNVDMLKFDATKYSSEDLLIDGQRIGKATIYGDSFLTVFQGGKWHSDLEKRMDNAVLTGIAPPSPKFRLFDELSRLKQPARGGPFKLAFQNRMSFVVGTHGTAEENDWAMNKARFDAEQWYYRGNGSVPIYRDDQPLPSDRNLIIYGNSTTFSKWKDLLGNSPLQVSRTGATLNGKNYDGNDIAALWLYPNGNRMIGVIAPTGMKAARYLARIPYFTSGVALPDWTITSAQTLKESSKAVIGCGFFGNDWKYDEKNSAWK